MTKARDIASAIPAPSTVSSAELGYLDGVTSAIQTQVDGKTAKSTLTTTGDIYYASAANTPARLAIGSTSNVLTVAGGIPSWAAPAGGGPTYAVFADEKASGGGGTFTTGAWRTRDINTTTYNGITGCSLASNQITLAAGTYILEAHLPFQDSDLTAARVYNITDSSVAGFGGNAYLSLNSSDAESIIITAFTITGSKVFELQHQGTKTRAGTGFGQNNGLQTEVYTQVLIQKIA